MTFKPHRDDGPLAAEALVIATNAHGLADQRRKFTNEPYITHPIAVAAIVRRVGGTDEMIAAAYLHDVLEDTSMSRVHLRRRFPAHVIGIVAEITNPWQPADMRRELRASINRMHLKKARPDAQTVKLADIIDNLSSLTTAVAGDFAYVYFKEKLAQIDVLTDGNPTLWLEARQLVAAFFRAHSIGESL